MLNRITSYLMIGLLSFPPVFLYHPKNADAFIPLLARSVVLIGQRVGLGKLQGSTITQALKPIQGRLFNLKSTNWTPFATSSAIAHAAVGYALFNSYADNSKNLCDSWRVNDTYGSSAIYNMPSSLDALSAFNTEFNKQYELQESTGSVDSNYLGVGQVRTGQIDCIAYSAQDVTAQDDFISDIELLPQEQQSEQIAQAFAKMVDVVENSGEPVSTSGVGLTLEEVTSQTVTSIDPLTGNIISRNLTIDPVTGEILMDGIPVSDSIDVIDINDTAHSFKADPVTGDIIDNNAPRGNFAEWVDKEGNSHVVSSHPVTGQLLDNGEPWNPNYTASTPSDGTATSTTVNSDGTTATTSTTTDYTPILQSNAKQLTEQKKTTDSINAQTQDMNKGLSDIYSAIIADTASQDNYSITQALTVDNYTAQQETRPMTQEGLTTAADTMIKASPLGSWSNSLALTSTVTAALPIFTVVLGSMGEFSFDMNDYTVFFDALGVMILALGAIYSIKVVFRTV